MPAKAKLYHGTVFYITPHQAWVVGETGIEEVDPEYLERIEGDLEDIDDPDLERRIIMQFAIYHQAVSWENLEFGRLQAVVGEAENG